MKLPIALQLYSVRDIAEQEPEKILREIKSYGYDGVELSGFYGKTPAEMASLLADIGLIPVSAHVGIDLMRQDMEKVIDDYKAIGCEYIAVPWIAEADCPGKENWENTRRDITRFASLAHEKGMKLCYHNHDFEFEKVGDKYILDIIYEEIPSLLVEQDSCWVSVSGESPEEYLKKYKARTPLLHLKDYTGNKKDGSFQSRPNGYGVMNFKSVIAAAEDNGVEWLIVEQDEPAMDKTSMECAKLSIEYLKTEVM